MARSFQDIFRRVHAEHPNCLNDEWVSQPCRYANGADADRPIIWSRRNGPWRKVDILWVGAAPGNAGGKGAGNMGAHGTRIPFGGDIAGANLEVLFGSIGTNRNETFITAAFNQLPATGGGEPTLSELNAPVGDYPSSVRLLRDTLLATQPKLVVALGNVGLRTLLAAGRVVTDGVKLPSLAKLAKAGLVRGRAVTWPDALEPDPALRGDWSNDELPVVLWLTHPSAQNMSPFAGRDTLFHQRMLEARTALRAAVRTHLKRDVPSERAATPRTGIYALKEWQELIRPRQELLDGLWREKGV